MILSPCTLAAGGLAWLMADAHPQRVYPQANEFPPLPARRVVVYLPDDPYWLLLTLQHAASLLRQMRRPMSMLILSRLSASWLWPTLQKLTKNPQALACVRMSSSDLPCAQLAALLRGGCTSSPRLALQAQRERQSGFPHYEGLTPKEVLALVDLFHGDSIRQQSQTRQRSHKTLYCQRMSGLRKMAGPFPSLTAHLPHARQMPQTETLSAFEREFMQAIHSRQWYTVFQPIVNQHLRLQGFELLARWYRDGHILTPGKFLPPIRSHYAWLLLTASTIQQAVRQINACEGRYYFSVNIPPCLANHHALVPMMDAARRQLHDPAWTPQLVLECAETTDLRPDEQRATSLLRLQSQGFRIMLDDCFSHNSVILPVRTLRFSDYKLDKSIVDDCQHDAHARALVKSLVYFAELTGSGCIAEGVDSEKKLEMLRGMGVTGYQGYFISLPVTERELGGVMGRYG